MIRGISVTSRALTVQLFETVTTPVWWYTMGVVWLLQTLKNSAAHTWRQLGVGLWMKNLFVPMYGQSDIWGRIISFVIRAANIVFRLCGMAVWMVFLSVVAVAWCAGPLAAVVLLWIGVTNIFS